MYGYDVTSAYVMSDLLRLPFRPTLANLHLNDLEPVGGQLAKFVTGPSWDSLEHLTLAWLGGVAKPPRLEPLGTATAFPALRSLRVCAATLDDTWAEAFVSSALFGQLHELNLFSQTMTAAGVRHLAHGLTAGRLTGLRIDAPSLSPSDRKKLAAEFGPRLMLSRPPHDVFKP